jgi:transposase
MERVERGMDVRTFYAGLVGIVAPWRVKDVTMDVAARRVEVHLECQEGTVWGDPELGRVHVHSWEVRRWRHLDRCGFTTEVVAAVPRLKYPDGTTRMAAVPWADRYARWTRPYERFAILVLQGARSVKEGCALLGIGWDLGQRIMAHAVVRGLASRSLEGIRYLGLDEKSFRRGQDFVTVLNELGPESRVLEVTEGRSQASGDAALARLSPEQRAGVEAVAMDCAAGYRACTEKRLPRAEVVHDQFHASQLLSQAVDEVRRAEHRQRCAAGDERLTGSRYLFLKGFEKLEPDDRESLEALLRCDLKVGRAWTLKEQFRHFWTRPGMEEALDCFETWYGRAIRSRLAPMKRVARTFQKHLFGLLNYYTHAITNAASEGLNSRIQALKANARGFRSFENYRVSILFHLGKLDLSL